MLHYSRKKCILEKTGLWTFEFLGNRVLWTLILDHECHESKNWNQKSKSKGELFQNARVIYIIGIMIILSMYSVSGSMCWPGLVLNGVNWADP